MLGGVDLRLHGIAMQADEFLQALVPLLLKSLMHYKRLHCGGTRKACSKYYRSVIQGLYVSLPHIILGNLTSKVNLLLSKESSQAAFCTVAKFRLLFHS